MKIVKRLSIAFLIVSVAFVDPSLAANKKRTVVKPRQSRGEVIITVAGQHRKYHQLGTSQPSIVEVKGPGELQIMTRARVNAATSGEVNYGLLYRIDGGEQRSFEVEGVERAPDASYQNDGEWSPSDPENLTLSIGRGNHIIAIMLRDSVASVAARYLFAATKQKKAKWVAMSPLPPIEPVDLYAGEQTIHCYRFSSERPLKIDIIGPTEVRILTRVENSFDMKGRATYRVQVRHEGQVVQSFQLSSKRSETTSYKNNPKLVPGKVREITLTVPKGKQRYEIVALDNRTLLGQILFPQKDAKLGL